MLQVRKDERSNPNDRPKLRIALGVLGKVTNGRGYDHAGLLTYCQLVEPQWRRQVNQTAQE
jgi:hypothetical protein